MAKLFSVDGLAEKHRVIKNLARKLEFDIYHDTDDHGVGIVFLSFRPDAPKLIMVISGTHGVEGPAGYDLQMALLERRVHEKLPSDVGLVFVVALNLWGWAHGRRTDENNVDLNRNGWRGTFPGLPPLEPEIDGLVNPEVCDDKWYGKILVTLSNPAAAARLRAQVFRGQYNNPPAVFYGGRERTWSLRQFEHYLRKHLSATCRRLAVLDIHTGLGEWGEITLISTAGPDDSELFKRVKRWFGLAPVFPNLGQTDTINAVSSDLLAFVEGCLPKTEVTALACEIGTVPFEEGFPVLVMENLLYRRPTTEFVFSLLGCRLLPTTPERVRRRFSQVFYPPDSGDSEWSAATRAGFEPIFRTAVRGLTEA